MKSLFNDMDILPYQNDTWNLWTVKSKHVPFKSTENGIGDGEHRLGAEYDVKPLGQNFTYDLDIINEKWEVKKLDDDNSFRLGVEVASNYRQIIDSATRILENVVALEVSLLESSVEKKIKQSINLIENTSGRTTTLLLNGLRKNEVSEANLNKANQIIETLKKLIITEPKEVVLFSSHDGTKMKYDVRVAIKKLSLEPISIHETLECLGGDFDFYNKLLLTNAISDDISNFFYEKSLKEKLDELVRSLFLDLKLVLVHETKGYKPISDLSKIYCNRITSGNPRCKVL